MTVPQELVGQVRALVARYEEESTPGADLRSSSVGARSIAGGKVEISLRCGRAKLRVDQGEVVARVATIFEGLRG